MGESSSNLTRRKFMIAGSAAVAAPLIVNMAGLVSDAKAMEKAKEKVSYVISDDCVGCHHCFNECPQSAIHWGDDKYMIDQDKCIQCGTCAEVCNIGAAHRQVVINPAS